MAALACADSVRRRCRRAPGPRRRPHLRVRPHPAGSVELEYQVVEHDRPRGAGPQAKDGTAVSCTFEGNGDGTVFRRMLEVGSLFGGQEPLPAGNGTEEASVANLKALVENIVWREQEGRYLR